MSFKATNLSSLIIAASLVLLPLTATRAASQDYDVEIVVYASLRADDGAEQWPTPKVFPATEQALNLGEGGTRLLTGGALNLQAIADTLRRSSLYRPLLHWRWRQPGWERGQARAIHVQLPAAGTSGQPLLDGTLTLTRSRYLHMAVDLIYIDPNTGSALQLKESRRMRSSELHYLDQPRFGALVQVTPVVAAQ